MENQVEIWKKHPDIPGIEVSSFGRVRSTKEYYYACHVNSKGYLTVAFRVNGKVISKLVHRLAAETFVPNPDNLAYAHHKDGNKTNNNASNLDWYAAKSANYDCGVLSHPIFAINLSTLEVSKFSSQNKASEYLGIDRIGIINVIKGRQKTANGFCFVNADDNAIDTVKCKLCEIGKTKLASADKAIAAFTRQVNLLAKNC